MKVIFLEDVAGTADAGEVKEVKNGFARNFLLPKRLAAPATPDQMQRLRAIEKAAESLRLKFSKEWESVAEAMNGTAITIEVRVGPSGRLFGAVLTESTGREIDHRQVLLSEAIHEPGEYSIAIRLYRGVHANITANVVPEGMTPEEAAAMAEITAGEKAAFDTAQTTNESDADGEGLGELEADAAIQVAAESTDEREPEEESI